MSLCLSLTDTSAQFMIQLVGLVQQLANFGFYHRYDQETRQTAADFTNIKKVLHPLLKILDGRTDFCAAAEGLSADEARLEVRNAESGRFEV